MRRLFALMGLFPCLALPAYAAPVDISGGVERFVWQEYGDGGSKLLKESGQRLFVAVEAENEVSDRWTYGFRSRVYSGTVDYDGQSWASASHATESDYDGVAILADFTGRFIGAAGGYSDLGLRFGLGGEAWRRHILSNQGVSGHTEEYVVVFGKLGLAYIPEQGWLGEVGAKYPFAVDVDVDIDDDVSLSPRGAFSFYARIGYNFNQRWSIKGYYDSYRFKASDPEPLSSGGVVVNPAVIQPESAMDTLGISVGFYF